MIGNEMDYRKLPLAGTRLRGYPGLQISSGLTFIFTVGFGESWLAPAGCSRPSTQ
jgi:hypothetical protein